jgi:hypothetical protein
MIFSFGFLSIFYLFNKKFNEYRNYLLMKELAVLDRTSQKDVLGSYVNSKKLKSDEEKLRKISLKKYWKEPMAWH